MKYEISTLISHEKETVYRINCFRVLVLILEVSFHFYKNTKPSNLPML